MSEASKIWIALPDKLLAELDHVAHETGMSRDDVLRRAVEVYVDRSTQAQLCASMAQGYQEMAHLNLALALDEEETLGDWQGEGNAYSEADPRGGL